MTNAGLQHSVMPLDGGGFVVTVVCYTPAIFAAFKARLDSVHPAAFIPAGAIAQDMADALLRAGLIVDENGECLSGNCE
jgi:hypothetical protein